MVSLPNFVKRLDMFGAPVPSFNIEGQRSMKTNCGAIATILMISITIMFTLVKLEHLVLKKNPSLTTNVEQLEQGERFDSA